MSNHIKPKKSDLLMELSEEEQEAVAGGGSSSLGLYDFFLQKTDIATFSNNETSASDGVQSFSSKQQTGYILSQLTFGFNGGRKQRRKGRSRGWSDRELLYFALMSLFS